MVHLTWHVTFPGLTPVNITYGNDSLINVSTDMGMNVSATLIRYEADQYIESVIKFTLVKNVTLNGTLLECSIAPSLDSDFMFVLVNTSGKSFYNNLVKFLNVTFIMSVLSQFLFLQSTSMLLMNYTEFLISLSHLNGIHLKNLVLQSL